MFARLTLTAVLFAAFCGIIVTVTPYIQRNPNLVLYAMMALLGTMVLFMCFAAASALLNRVS